MFRPPIPLTAFGLAAAASLATPGDLAAEDDLFRHLPAEARDLHALRWSHRPVLLFAPSSGDAAYAAQMELLHAAEEGLRARDIVVLSDLDPRSPGPIRQAFCPGGFKLVLVGKDGGVKLEEKAVIDPEQLFALIDRMPMRQREIAQ
ncbi:DUF4174 domain-containing protein [Salipiger mangrovisoli]|uniref:DUF4174 domain-containing protein n=1 Tax=Salipiger mangrovisoli TaxID=2865933 RepID=A0ABR9WX33_9RHOB|nr:DUF4174 domain-containing protein [Salipiger mangrovisoli]MBE9635856.1 DUF4174 domain-containing protein [Salipiger mangrovisoli]